jgi:hypothetical protein
MPSLRSYHDTSLPIWLRPGIILPIEALIRAWPIGLHILKPGVSSMCSTVTLANLGEVGISALPRYDFLATPAREVPVAVETHDE